VLRRVYEDVSQKLNAQSVSRNMFQSNALTLKELQTIQSKHSEPIKAAEQLLNIVMNQSSNVYGYFINALKVTDQKHVYDIIINGSYQGKTSQINRMCHVLEEATVVSRIFCCNKFETVRVRSVREGG